MTLGVAVALVAVAGALGFGLWRRAVDGRFAGSAETPAEVPVAEDSAVAGTAFAERLGERGTLLQFSSAFCAPCRATRTVLADVVAGRPEIAHVEVDAEQHLDLVRRLDVRRTPTTLVLDGAGREVARAAGAPTRAQVDAALAQLR